MTSIPDDEEVLRALKFLEALIKAHGLTKKALDQRLGKGPGYISQVLTGRMELKFRHILEILGALELEPGLFFRALFLEPESSHHEPQLMERFLQSLGQSNAFGSRAIAPPPLPAIDPDELDRRIRSAIHQALSERAVADGD
jgi:transcriptional regulator with XRE-family HTH domain